MKSSSLSLADLQLFNGIDTGHSLPTLPARIAGAVLSIPMMDLQEGADLLHAPARKWR
eukprot:XP_001703838.1 Hypothetical protein GL50803_118089 [Giardia lamblia ATCC 50803]